MARIAGITLERNTKGETTFVRIDVRKYGEKLSPFLKEIGIEDDVSPYNKKFVEKIKSQEGMPSKVIKIEDLWK